MPKAWELPDHRMYIYTITGMGIKISHKVGKMPYIANIYIYMRDFNYSVFKIQNLNRH